MADSTNVQPVEQDNISLGKVLEDRSNLMNLEWHYRL